MSQCASLYSQWTGYVQFQLSSAPVGSACGYVYMTGSEYQALIDQQSQGSSVALTEAEAIPITAAFIGLMATAFIFRVFRRQIEEVEIGSSDEKH